MVALGISMIRSDVGLQKVMGGVAIGFGIYYLLKPFLAAWMITLRRRQSGAADREIQLALDPTGVEIDDGKIRTKLGWSEVVSAGRGREYVWYELRGGQRATIPLKAVDDEPALVATLREHTEWRD